jgi:hypothetical protein
MKIKLWSDLHLEFRNYLFDHIYDLDWIEPGRDKETTLLLAGDIGVGTAASSFVTEMCKHFKYVLMVCGNHEFYHNEFDSVIAGWREVEESLPNFHFLHNEWRVLDGVRFLGGTMWTDFNGGDPLAMAAAHRIMSDFAEIKIGRHPWTPRDTIREHDRFIDFLLTEFDKPFDGKTVVMSHHSPGNELRRKGRVGDLVGSAYFADVEEMIGFHNKAVLWVHGHTHQNWDYTINETRVVCNPYGYWGDSTNRGFDSEMILEI